MQARRNSLANRIQQFGFGLALAAASMFAATLSAQTNQSFRFADQPQISYEAQPRMITPVQSEASQATPIIKSVHQYSLDQQGFLTGRVAAGNTSPANLKVVVVANQSIIGQATTDRTGSFALQGIAPGRYSLFVSGKNRFAAQGISIVRASETNANRSLDLTTVSTGYSGIQQLMSNALLPNVQQSNQIPTTQVSTVISDVEVAKQVRIINGRIRGQISSLISASNASGVQVHLIQNNQPIAQVETNELGSFLIPDVQPGIYDFVAVGQKGFAALQIEAIGSRSPMTKISYQADVSSVIEVPLAEDVVQADIPVAADAQFVPGNEVYMEPAIANQSMGAVEYAGESIGCGCAGGGSAGTYGNFTNFGNGGMVGGRLGGRFGSGFRGGLGGGRLAGTSGLGRLLTLGAVAGSIVAIADDDPGAASPSN